MGKGFMKGGEQDMKKISVNINKFSENCPICGITIINNSPEGVKYNLKLHLEKHSKKLAIVDENIK